MKSCSGAKTSACLETEDWITVLALFAVSCEAIAFTASELCTLGMKNTFSASANRKMHAKRNRACLPSSSGMRGPDGMEGALGIAADFMPARISNLPSSDSECSAERG